jgi:hypothetical protein
MMRSIGVLTNMFHIRIVPRNNASKYAQHLFVPATRIALSLLIILHSIATAQTVCDYETEKRAGTYPLAGTKGYVPALFLTASLY